MDSFSTDNAIILENSERWSLMIDPQMQANMWLRKMYQEEGTDALDMVVKPTMDQKIMSRKIESSITLGNTIIFEDAIETFDPLLDPLLSKAIIKQNNEQYIKFGDNLCSFDPNFRFFITTKMSRPHYSPEICVKVTILNFMVTPEGLQDQLLNIVVQLEAEKSYHRRQQCIKSQAENTKVIAELQDKILNQIAHSDENILDDFELKTSLEESNEKTLQISKDLEEAKQTISSIETILESFKPLAFRGSRLFFILDKLVNIDPMY